MTFELSQRFYFEAAHTLRRKIETDPANPLHLQTVRGYGYKLAIER